MKVLYFAEVKEILNMSNEYIDILEPKTVKEIRQLLNQYHPELMDKKFQIAVNEEFTKEDGIVQPNDIIALIPPVSGG
ncbi:molybdopterin converting factor subunit 1 [Staphylococcus lugdunensis]|uniref:molybdopterin converting factor subunit 1 n=1 Tax=Staphylococcus lugdunensis TaxID=28035 RepID=UPI001F4D082B|nr:molybdopterin converting factor subunit 1 [Staphylococcus lugdunensis]